MALEPLLQLSTGNRRGKKKTCSQSPFLEADGKPGRYKLGLQPCTWGLACYFEPPSKRESHIPHLGVNCCAGPREI